MGDNNPCDKYKPEEPDMCCDKPNTKDPELNCDKFDIKDPEREYQKFLKLKPRINSKNLYDGLHVPEKIKCPYLFKGYGKDLAKNPMYRTVNSEYGMFSPNEYTIPIRNFLPLSQKFSNRAYKHGMYRNYSLNTQMDKNIRG